MHMRGIRYERKLRTLPSSSTVKPPLQKKRKIPQKVIKAGGDSVAEREDKRVLKTDKQDKRQ